MIAQELINHDIPVLKVTDTIRQAILWVEKFRYNHIPITKKKKWLGFISTETILASTIQQQPLVDFQLIASDCFVSTHTHLYEILKTITDHKTQLVAVVDDAHQYVGVITLQDLMAAMAQSGMVQMQGSILVLSMNWIDYSLTEISRHVEEHHAKIISSTLTEDKVNKNNVILTLKINQKDIKKIVATLERFNYRIIENYQELSLNDEDRKKIDLLLHYLEI